MSYYGYRNKNGIGCFGLIAGFLIVGAIMLGVNTFAEPRWNEGICPDCAVRYELRAASRGLKYYACPDCGQEVKRY